MTITLFVDGYFTSPYDATCYVALVEKGVEFGITRALLRDGQGVPPGLHALTALGRVPALRHDDLYLTESIAIAEYIDEAFPGPPVMPRDVRARARARQILAYVRTDLRNLREERPWHATIYPVAQRPLSAAAAQDARELVGFAEHVVRTGALGAWSIAHLDLAFALHRVVATEIPLPEAVRQFVDGVVARPSVRSYLDHPRPPHPPP